MIKTKMIPTNEYYHRIIDAIDTSTREALYKDLFIAPWQQMMDMVGGMMSTDYRDEFSGARALHWLLPDDLTTVPVSLERLEKSDAWNIAADALAEASGRFEPVSEQIPMSDIEGWLILADPATSDPIMRGYTGAIDFMQPRFVGQYDTPNDYNVSRLPGLVVHEMHHLIRGRLFPWDMVNTSVADYIIHEGLAEAFAASLFGDDCVAYFVTDISDDDLQTARRIIGDGLTKTGFNVIRGYLFGDHWGGKFGIQSNLGMPAYGGYATGYRVVRAFMERTGASIEDATFLPAQTIVGESGYFPN